ncbi:hypothetical protein ACHAXR_009536 [Thalassiosira sp. AJA248-18]
MELSRSRGGDGARIECDETIVVETHDLPAVFFLRDAIASCHAVGRTTASRRGVFIHHGHARLRRIRRDPGSVERNNGCSAKATEDWVLQMMAAQGSNATKRSATQKNNSPPKRTSVKRDAAGHFLKESAASSSSLGPRPEYLMPLYQVRRAPSYTHRSPQFHNWSRLTLAREIKEMGLAVAVGPMGYVSMAASSAASSSNAASAARCDVVEVLFGNDEYNINERELAFDETVAKLEEYENQIEEFIAEKDGGDDDNNDELDNNNQARMMTGIASSDSAAGDPYSNTSYKGEKANRRHAGGVRRRGGKKTYYSPNTISSKLYSACLPYVRTSPPNPSSGDGVDGSGVGSGGAAPGSAGTANSSSVNDNYFHYLTSAPPAQMVCDAAFRCDRDQQASLLGNVVVCGGGSCITGAAGVGGAMGGLGTAASGAGAVASALGDEHAFPDRLREEVEAIVHRHTPGWRVKVTSPNISERAICSWLGGSILGSLGTFQDMWISKRDYEEFGAAIVNRKCP